MAATKFNLGSLLSRVHIPFPAFVTDNALYKNNTTRLLLFALGAGYTVYTALSYVKSIVAPLFTRIGDLSGRYGPNTWVVITGCTEGIGKAFAFEFARRGFNIVLVARNSEKLNTVEKELKTVNPEVKTKIVVSDFTNSYKEGFAEEIYEQVRDLDVSILVNNAGVWDADYYHRIPVQNIRNLVLTNVLAHALITRVFLPRLAARTTKSAIIDVASLASAMPKPYEQIYSASKAFHNFLSVGLSYEHPNLDILSMNPGPISTNLNNYKSLDLKTITAEDFVRVSLENLSKTNHTYGHWKHRLDKWGMDHLPGFYFEKYWRNRFGVQKDTKGEECH